MCVLLLTSGTDLNEDFSPCRRLPQWKPLLRHKSADQWGSCRHQDTLHGMPVMSTLVVVPQEKHLLFWK